MLEGRCVAAVAGCHSSTLNPSPQVCQPSTLESASGRCEIHHLTPACLVEAFGSGHGSIRYVISQDIVYTLTHNIADRMSHSIVDR